MSYTIERVNDFLRKDEATLIGDLPKLNKDARITFTCKCGKQDDKSFVRITFSGVLCKECTMISMRQKRENTNLERYGNTCSLQSPDIIKKSKETLIAKYGTDCAFKSTDILEKIKQTNIAKYGVENPFSSKDIIKKLRETNKEKYGSEFPMQNVIVAQQTKTTCLEKYGVEVSSKADSVKQKAKETNFEKYGLTHHAVPEVLDKIKATNLEKYGVEHSFQAEPVKAKIKETMKERYDAEHSMHVESIRSKARQTMLKNHGVEYSMQSAACREKAKQTSLKHFGVEHPNQSPEVQAKSQKIGLKYKDYTTPNGTIRKIQGFEHFALDKIFNELKLSEDDVITGRKDVPRIQYTDNDGKSHYYFPDIYIKSQNKIVEVKSTWTYSLHKEINTLKWNKTISDGYIMEFWIFDHSGKCTIMDNPNKSIVKFIFIWLLNVHNSIILFIIC